MPAHISQLGTHQLTAPHRPLIMGIVNINDDSFSGDGSLELTALRSQIISQIENGADIIDLGAESARTNRGPITEEEELRRLNSVLCEWEQIYSSATPKDSSQLYPPALSINTWRVGVIRELLSSRYASQLSLINDMSALADPETARIVAESQASLLIMHSVGMPKENHTHQHWENILNTLQNFFTEKCKVALEAGIPRERLVLDPGLDFAKTPQDSLKILHTLSLLERFGSLILLPISRKNFILEVTGEEVAAERDAGTLATLSFITASPLTIVRVHNVRATWQALKVLRAVT